MDDPDFFELERRKERISASHDILLEELQKQKGLIEQLTVKQVERAMALLGIADLDELERLIQTVREIRERDG